jgi:hypothetical protein
MSSLLHPFLAALLVLILQGCAGVPAEPPKIERISAEQLEASLAQPVAAMPLEQIVALSRQGIPAAELIGRIKSSGSRYRLSATHITEMEKQGVPLAVLDHMVSAERSYIFDGMAADANNREQACRERIAQEVFNCRSQTFGPMWFPGPQPMMNCFPLGPGSLLWRCM